MHFFLSYLCGSELTQINTKKYIRFLSYLCGSELDDGTECWYSVFLSYLCGSELKISDLLMFVEFSKLPVR